MDLCLKAEAADPPQDNRWGQPWPKGTPFPHPPAFFSMGLLPGLGHSQHSAPPLLSRVGRQAEAFAGAVLGGQFSQSKERSRTELAPASSDVDIAG